jgi:hypothetical protein
MKSLDDVDRAQPKGYSMTNSRRNYRHSFDNCAIYTPALSSTYVRFVEDNKNTGLFPFKPKDLNFLDPNSQLFHYPWALYSAGQAAATPKSAKQQTWVSKSKRHPNTFVVGDSGGFQIQEDKAIKFEGTATLDRMLRWMEKTSDYSMILDFPTGGIGMGTIRQHVHRLQSEGIDVVGEAKKHGFSKDYMACLLQTELNNQYFQKHRQAGATALLNVMQGRNEKESRFWYERMRDFPFEGIAFAGKHSVQFSLTLRRIFQMLEDGLLKNCPWIHFLGVSTLRTAAILTVLQRHLREHPNANKHIQITFDSISGIKAVAYGYNAYAGFDLDPKSWRFKQVKMSVSEFEKDTRSLNQILQQHTGFTYKMGSEIGDHISPAQMLSRKKDKLTGIDTIYMPSHHSYCLMNHNMEVLIRGFMHLGSIVEKQGLDMPQSVSNVMAIINHVFETKLRNPFDIIDECASVLDALVME